MSRTDIDAATFADYLRQVCGDSSVEWSYEPMQTSVLLDIADMLDENTKLQDENARLRSCLSDDADNARAIIGENARLCELCETFGMIANDAICDYYERDEMLARANEDARELGVEL